ncbi:hypothetical protein LEN26_015747 [Aphanomyces euteiches]|nr:hypothetical protein LEN26_015747 [Aphanomyces euteiches]
MTGKVEVKPPAVESRPTEAEPPPIAALPLPLHVHVRLIISGVYLSQLSLQVSLQVALHVTSPSFIVTLLPSKTFIWLFIFVQFVCLLLLYHRRIAYPYSGVVLTIYTSCLACILAALDFYYSTWTALYLCATFLAAMCVHGLVGSIKTRQDGLLSYRICGIVAATVVFAISSLVNFVGFSPPLLPVPVFFIGHGFVVLLIAWTSYVASRVADRCLRRLCHGPMPMHRVVIFYTDVALFVYFLVSVLFSCVAFEGCACCGASDELPGAVDFVYPLLHPTKGDVAPDPAAATTLATTVATTSRKQ